MNRDTFLRFFPFGQPTLLNEVALSEESGAFSSELVGLDLEANTGGPSTVFSINTLKSAKGKKIPPIIDRSNQAITCNMQK